MSARLRDRDEVLGLVIAATVEYTNRVHEIKATAAAKYSPAVTLCCSYITEHIHENITLEELSKICAFSKEHLSRIFRKETGTTIKKYYLEKKMELAAYLLQYSERPVQDIAYFLGFSSHGRFSGYFRQQYGVSPKEYRRSRA
jgi:AraC-like DNA-binding protein